MKKQLCIWLCMALLMGSAYAAGEFEGVVAGGETVTVSAPFGGVVNHLALRAGALLNVGDEIARINTTRVLATEDGTIRGVFAEAGDSAAGTVLYLAPVSKYTITCTIDQAYRSTATKYVTIGEKVYIKCTKDGSHKAEGVVTAVDGSGYTVQATAGELYMEETVYLYRTPDYQPKQRIGSGKVSRTGAIAVSGTGSVIKMHVSDGDDVERGQVLFETVEGEIDALVVVDEVIRSTVDGVVHELKLDAGQKVNKGDVVLTAYRVEDYQICFSIPEDFLNEVSIGQQAQIYFNWNEDKSAPYAGVVTDISYVSETVEEGGETSYSGYIAFDADETVRIGMNVTVVLE